MKGITIQHLSLEQYNEKWIRRLEEEASDTSQIKLRVLYYDELNFANGITPLEPIDETVFDLMIAPKECESNVLSAPSMSGTQPMKITVG